jgi:hypothetical protein
VPARVMGFVDDYEIPFGFGNEIALSLTPCELDTRNDVRWISDIPRILVRMSLSQLAKHESVVRDEGLVEFGPKLLLPLGDKACGREDEDSVQHFARAELFQNQPSFDCLPKADFVRQDEARLRFLERTECDRDLMALWVNA